MLHYDLIGDIHGYADKLEQLLYKLGYRRRHGIYRHPEGRKAIFVGDLIDRGPAIRTTLHLVKDMYDAGEALVVMGNHEFNAISFHTPHTEYGGFFREHGIGEIEQHLETLRQFQRFGQEWQLFLDWFADLPLFLDLEHLRVVHASWDHGHIQWLKSNYSGINTELLQLANNRQERSGVFSIINQTLKGKEYPLPEGYHFTDRTGVIRSESRIRWWGTANEAPTYGNYLMDCPREIRDLAAPADLLANRYTDDVPVFFGHYWLRGTPLVHNPKAICLDYSVAREGKMAACRFDKTDGPHQLTMVYV